MGLFKDEMGGPSVWAIIGGVAVLGGAIIAGLTWSAAREDAEARAAGRVGPARALEWAKKFGAREDRIDCIEGPTWRGTWRCACVMARCTP